MGNTTKPTHVVMTPTNFNKLHREENDYPKPIGSAWMHQDGNGLTVQLFATPLYGKLIIFKCKDEDTQQS